MKKIVMLLLSAMMALSLSACSSAPAETEGEIISTGIGPGNEMAEMEVVERRGARKNSYYVMKER